MKFSLGAAIGGFADTVANNIQEKDKERRQMVNSLGLYLRKKGVDEAYQIRKLGRAQKALNGSMNTYYDMYDGVLEPAAVDRLAAGLISKYDGDISQVEMALQTMAHRARQESQPSAKNVYLTGKDGTLGPFNVATPEGLAQYNEYRRKGYTPDRFGEPSEYDTARDLAGLGTRGGGTQGAAPDQPIMPADGTQGAGGNQQPKQQQQVPAPQQTGAVQQTPEAQDLRSVIAANQDLIARFQDESLGLPPLTEQHYATIWQNVGQDPDAFREFLEFMAQGE